MKSEDKEQASWFASLEMQRQKDRAAMFDELVAIAQEIIDSANEYTSPVLLRLATAILAKAEKLK